MASKGFERDMVFGMATHDIRALPKLEGTVHVNIALIVKFMANYFFAPAESAIAHGRRPGTMTSSLRRFHRGLGKIQFHDYNLAYGLYDLPNVAAFREQIRVFKKLLATATPDEAQQEGPDFLLALGELFTLVVYGQLILENARLYAVDDATVDQIFDFMVRDFAKYALQLLQQTEQHPRADGSVPEDDPQAGRGRGR